MDLFSNIYIYKTNLKQTSGARHTQALDTARNYLTFFSKELIRAYNLSEFTLFEFRSFALRYKCGESKNFTRLGIARTCNTPRELLL